MKVNLRKLLPHSKGFIIKINDGHYGENFQDQPIQEVNIGDIFLYSLPKHSYILIKLENENSYDVLCEDHDGSDKNTFAYIKSLRGHLLG